MIKDNADVHVVSFATQDYSKFQKSMIASAKKFNLTNFWIYNEKKTFRYRILYR